MAGGLCLYLVAWLLPVRTDGSQDRFLSKNGRADVCATQLACLDPAVRTQLLECLWRDFSLG